MSRKAKKNLPPNVHEKHGRFYLVAQVKGERKWTALTPVRLGLPALYRALAEAVKAPGDEAMMRKLVENWMLEVGVEHKDKQQANDRTHNKAIAEAFAKFRADQIKPPNVIEFLKQFKKMPRSYNAYRAALRERLRYAEEKGLIPPGSNPVDSIKTMKTPPRTRYLTDSEVRRIKVAACYGEDGKRTPSGHTICRLIDMAYLTGQRIGDLLSLEWADIRKDGIHFEPGKTEDSTGVRIVIGRTARLDEVIESLRNPPAIPGKKEKAKPVSLRWVFSKLNGERYTYDGASTAWTRARERARTHAVNVTVAKKRPETKILLNAHFHDLRAKALTDKDEAEGRRKASSMGGHATEAQTATYIRHRTARRADATR